MPRPAEREVMGIEGVSSRIARHPEPDPRAADPAGRGHGHEDHTRPRRPSGGTFADHLAEAMATSRRRDEDYS